MVSIVLPPRDGGTDPVVTVPTTGGGAASEATFPRAVGPAGPGVAPGGTTGQVLAKASGTDYDTEWVTGGGGGVSPPFPISDITGLQTALDGKQPLDADLTAIAALTGTNTLYYRSADSVWSPVTIGTNLTFTGGTLSATGGGVSPPFAISDTTGLQTALDGKQPLDSDLTAIAALTTTTFGRARLTDADASAAKTALSLVKGDVGLANVDNTSDAAKPVSTAQQTALNLKANLASPTFTGTVGGITAAMVGLGNVTNTSDANKPVSTAQQAALDLKANLASPTFTGTVSGISKAMVGLGNVDNTSDANKPVSTANQTALNLKANLASPTFTGTVTLPAGQVVNGVTLITGGSATTYLDATGAYSTPAGGGGGSVAWGAITGTLSAQTDLQAALNLKANLASPTFTGTVTLPAGQVVNGVTLTTGGSATTFLNAAGAYTTPAGGGGGSDPTDPSVAQVIVDEFLMGSLETGEVGALGWSFLNGSVSGVNASGRPGIVRRTSGVTASQVASFFAGNAGNQGILRFGDVDEMTWIVSPTTAGADFTIRVGLFEDMTVGGNPTGAHFERLSTDTNWFAKTVISGPTVTRTDTTVALTAGGWFKLKVRRITDTNYGFSINGGTEISITTNTPPATTGANFGVQIIPTTTTARVADIDFFSMKTRAISR